MFTQSHRKSRAKESAEKPFWISYSDLMLASMTLFLVVMAVQIVSLEKQYGTKDAKIRSELIQQCYKEISVEAKKSYPEVEIEYDFGDSIAVDLGAVVNFAKRDYRISAEGTRFLRNYIPSIIQSVKSPACSAYMRRVIVEGYTDTDGLYLPNLQLSQRRSAEVVCSLSNEIKAQEMMRVEDLNAVRDLFLVGGFSFNSYKPSKAENRRVVLKLEFWQLNEKEKYLKDTKFKVDISNKDFGKCPQY